MLQKFKSRLQSNKKASNDEKEEEDSAPSSKAAWLTHKMQCTGEDEIVLARDANIRNEEDWYIFKEKHISLITICLFLGTIFTTHGILWTNVDANDRAIDNFWLAKLFNVHSSHLFSSIHLK